MCFFGLFSAVFSRGSYGADFTMSLINHIGCNPICYNKHCEHFPALFDLDNWSTKLESEDSERDTCVSMIRRKIPIRAFIPGGGFITLVQKQAC